MFPPADSIGLELHVEQVRSDRGVVYLDLVSAVDYLVGAFWECEDELEIRSWERYGELRPTTTSELK
jgi:hypothetical protein